MQETTMKYAPDIPEYRACHLLHVDEDGAIMFLRNIGGFSTECMAFYARGDTTFLSLLNSEIKAFNINAVILY
jgi:hypothetical protein